MYRGIAMLPEEDEATATCNKHNKFGVDRTCSYAAMIVNKHTDTVITILCSPIGDRVTMKVTLHSLRQRSNIK